MLVGQDRLAGSALRMDRGVENLMRIAGLSLADAVRMATTNAARAGRVPARTQGLSPGERADLIQFSLTRLICPSVFNRLTYQVRECTESGPGRPRRELVH